MINKLPYINLEKYIDLESFDKLLPEIHRGMAVAADLRIVGSQEIYPGSINPTVQGLEFNPLYECYKTWNDLPDDDLLKLAGKDLDYNQLTTYLKYAFGGYDLYSRFVLFENCDQEIILEKCSEHFPLLITWILNLKNIGIFSSISGATIFVLDAGGIPFEHCDPIKTPEEAKQIPQFIHIKTDLDRPFYVKNSLTKEKCYMDTRVAWWDERDWHGGDPINRVTFTVRIDGCFSNDFINKILE
jgi:hypothetical protein